MDDTKRPSPEEVEAAIDTFDEATIDACDYAVSVAEINRRSLAKQAARADLLALLSAPHLSENTPVVSDTFRADEDEKMRAFVDGALWRETRSDIPAPMDRRQLAMAAWEYYGHSEKAALLALYRPAGETRDGDVYRGALVRVMAHTGRTGADGHTHDLSLANGLLDSIARIAGDAITAPPGSARERFDAIMAEIPPECCVHGVPHTAAEACPECAASDESDPLFVLAFCEGAIRDAIGLEDGLDGVVGEGVLAMIRNARAHVASAPPAGDGAEYQRGYRDARFRYDPDLQYGTALAGDGVPRVTDSTMLWLRECASPTSGCSLTIRRNAAEVLATLSYCATRQGGEGR